MLVITTPAGFERFVADVGSPTAVYDRLPEPRGPDVPRLIEIAGRYGLEFPSPPARARILTGGATGRPRHPARWSVAPVASGMSRSAARSLDGTGG